MIKKLLAVYLCLCFFGCSSFQIKDGSLNERFDIPEKYNVDTTGIKTIEKWWREFENPELDQLVEEGLLNNPSIKSLYESLKKSQASAAKNNAYIYPDLDLEGSSSIRQNHNKSTTTETKSSSLGLAASYEIDLWHRLKSEQDALALSAKAAQKDFEAGAVTLASEIVNAWKDLVTAKMKLNILEDVEKENKNQLELLKVRFKSGMVKGSSVYEQQKDLLSVSSDINSVKSDIKVLENKLMYLTGGSSAVTVTSLSLPSFPDFPKAGIPADLLSLRPDIKASELKYLSLSKDLDSAKKDRLPKLSLSGKASITSDDFSLSFDDWLSQLAVNLTMPLFKGGELKEEVNRVKAQKNEAFYDYASLFYKALNEVQDALAREEFQLRKLKLLEGRIKFANAGLYTAELEFKSGKGSYVSIIDKYNALKNLEVSYILEKSNLIEYRVSLYRALGNKWTENFVEEFKKANGK